MSVIDFYQVVLRSGADFSTPDRDKVGVTFFERFSAGIDGLFSEMSTDLPKSFSAIKENYGEPFVGIKSVAGRKKYDLIIPAKVGGGAIIGDLYLPSFHELYDFDDIYSALPLRIRSYYKACQGMQIVKSGVATLHWLDLPLALRGRRSLADFVAMEGVHRKIHKNEVGTDNLFVWVAGSEGNLILVDEGQKELYYLSGDLNSDPESIKFPEVFWDEYCAFVFEVGSQRGFDFKRYFAS